jgi:antitoxin (DNA-binding transcriptional repressor) of toxin-antitoxin stability system
LGEELSIERPAFLLTRDNIVVARLIPAETPATGPEFLKLWEERPRLDPADAEEWENDLQTARAMLSAPLDGKLGA